MSLRPFQQWLRELLNVDPLFAEASDHPYTCRCNKCLQWWKTVGPDPDTARYGPFTKEEIDAGTTSP